MKRLISVFLAVLVLLSGTYVAPSYALTDAPSSWAKEAVEELKSTGLFEESRFVNFEKPMTRQQFVYFLIKSYETMTGQEVKIDYGISFNDTSDEYALKAATVGLTNGTAPGVFSPNQTLDRKTMVAFIVKLLQKGNMELKPASTEKFADDTKIASWAKDYIMISRANNIVSGEPSGNFNPDGIATGQIAMILTNRILKESVGKTYTVDGVANVIKLERPEAVVNTPPVSVAIETTTWGRRLDFDFKSDNVTTTAGKTAFEAKYNLNGFALSSNIPTYWDITGTSPSPSDITTPFTWGSDNLAYYEKYSPQLIGKDGSTAPYDAVTPVFFQWIMESDKNVFVKTTQSSISEGGSYLSGQVRIIGSEGIVLVDNANNIRFKYEIDATMTSGTNSPMGIVLTRMILKYYFGEQYADEVYKLVTAPPESVKTLTAYQFGDRQIIFRKLYSNTNKIFEISGKGFEWDKYVKCITVDGTNQPKPSYFYDYISRPGVYEDYTSPSFKEWD